MGKKSKKLTKQEEDEMYYDISTTQHNYKNDFLKGIKIDVKPKTKNQKKLIKEIQDKEIVICSGLAGTGKAQPLTTNVLTPEGFKPMGQIKKGDEVITPNNKVVKVKEIFPQGVIPIYKITFSDNTVAECCKNHLWKVKINDQYEIIETKDLHYQDFEIEIPLTQPIQFDFNKHYLVNYKNRCNFIINELNTTFIYNKELNHIECEYFNSHYFNIVAYVLQSLGCLCYQKDNKIIVEIAQDFILFDRLNKEKYDISKFPHHLKRIIKNIEEIEPKEAQCILLDDEEHLYITDNFIVTHNTFLACASALELLKEDNPYKKIVIVKSVTTLKNEEIGYLKGPQPLYENILTPNGWVKMKDLKVGDFVIDENGEPVEILEIHDQPNKTKKEIYRITTNDERTVDCCIDHIWSVKEKNGEYSNKNTKYLLDNYKKTPLYLPKINSINYPTKELPLHPFILGVLLSPRASFNKNRIIVSLNIQEAHDKFVKLLKDDDLCDFTIGDDGKIFIQMSGLETPNKLDNIIRKLKLYDVRQPQYFIPSDYKHSSFEQRNEFLEGIHGGEIRMMFAAKSIELIEDLIDVYLSLGYSFRKKKIRKTKFYNVEFLKMSDAHCKITDISLLKSKSMVRCIKVASETGLYITNNFIVTHNTMQDKMEPFIYSFIHNFNKIIGAPNVKMLQSAGLIEELPIAYMRGINIDNSIVIIDECVHGDSYIDILLDGIKKRIMIKKLPFYYNNSNDIKIKSYNEKLNKFEYKNIETIKIGKTKKWYKFYLTNRKEPLIVTGEHPIAVFENNKIIYKKAENVTNKDIIIRGNIWNDNNHNIFNKGYDILLGFLLGDGSMIKNPQKYENVYRFRKTHGLNQLEYCKFCAKLFNANLGKLNKSGFSDKDICHFQSKSFYIDKNFKDTIYNEKNKKHISYDIINYFTEKTLATWFMDDGSNNQYNEEGSNIIFHTEGFNKQENEILIQILKEKFNIIAELKTTKKERYDRNGQYNTYFYLYLNNENSQKLQDLIKNYIHPNIQYKLNNKYRGYFNEFLYDIKLIEDISTIGINNIIIDNLDENELTYNLQVEDNENYLVNRVLTHNCQNISKENIRTILTRLGQDSKMIFLGDEFQIDMKDKDKSSLRFIIDKFKDVKEIGTVTLDENDIVRNPLIKKIEEIFKNIE